MHFLVLSSAVCTERETADARLVSFEYSVMKSCRLQNSAIKFCSLSFSYNV